MGNWTKAHKNLGLLEEKTWMLSDLHSLLWDFFTQNLWEALRDPNTGIPVKHVVGWSTWQRWIHCFSKIKRFYLKPKYWTLCLTNHTQLSDGLWCHSQHELRIRVGLQIPGIGMPKCDLFPPMEKNSPHCVTPLHTAEPCWSQQLHSWRGCLRSGQDIGTRSSHVVVEHGSEMQSRFKSKGKCLLLVLLEAASYGASLRDNMRLLTPVTRYGNPSSSYKWQGLVHWKQPWHMPHIASKTSVKCLC